MKSLFTYSVLLVAFVAAAFGKIGDYENSALDQSSQVIKTEAEQNVDQYLFVNELNNHHTTSFSKSQEENHKVRFSLEVDEEEENERESSLKNNGGDHYAFCAYLAQVKWELLGFKKNLLPLYSYLSNAQQSLYLIYQVFRI